MLIRLRWPYSQFWHNLVISPLFALSLAGQHDDLSPLRKKFSSHYKHLRREARMIFMKFLAAQLTTTGPKITVRLARCCCSG